MQKRIVVTGGAGFIGSHLTERLIREGNQVIVIDNLITGNLDNLSTLSGNSALTFLKQDVSNEIQIDGPIDEIFHFASPASPVDFDRFPIQVLKAGALGTHKTLGLAKSKGAKFILASTSEVYGDPLVHPQPESYNGNVNPVGPRGVYDEAKRYAEAMTMAYHRVHGVDSRIVRIFNTYGPKMRSDDGRVIPNFLHQSLHGDALTLYGDGNQTRCFTYIDDLIEGIMLLMATDFHDPVNLGSDEEITMNALASIFETVTGKQLGRQYLESPGDDPQRRKPDLTRVSQLTGWKATTPLQKGVSKILKKSENLVLKNHNFEV